MSAIDDAFEYSEFSIHEILYMGHEGLTYVVEQMLGASRDPFEILAEIEELLGHPLVIAMKGESPM